MKIVIKAYFVIQLDLNVSLSEQWVKHVHKELNDARWDTSVLNFLQVQLGQLVFSSSHRSMAQLLI